MPAVMFGETLVFNQQSRYKSFRYFFQYITHNINFLHITGKNKFVETNIYRFLNKFMLN